MVEIVAIGPHPDDIELACSGTLIKMRKMGYRIGIVHLTRGEKGTRGDEITRIKEAELAANIIGADELIFLDFKDSELKTGKKEEDLLIEILQTLKPSVVLSPPPFERHPDHERGYKIVKDACFYAGLKFRGSKAPWRPKARFCYMQHYTFVPTFLVDVTEVWDEKVRSILAYKSQFSLPKTPEELTRVSSPRFMKWLEGRHRYFGAMIGAEYAEPFLSETPLGVEDLTAVSKIVLP